MKTSDIKIQIRDWQGVIKMIPWRGHIVAGTEKTFAVTRAADFVDREVQPSTGWWTVTHIPTGRRHHLTERKKFSAAMKAARRMHKIFAKHGVAHSSDLEKIKVAATDFLKAFG